MRTADFFLNLLLILVVIFLSMSIVWPVRALVRWLRKQPPLERPATWAWRIAGLLSLLNVAYFVGLVAAIMTMGSGAFAHGIPASIIGLYTLPLIGVVLTLALIVLVVLAWKNRSGAWIGRAYTSLIAAAGVVFLWFLNTWSLLGYQF